MWSATYSLNEMVRTSKLQEMFPARVTSKGLTTDFGLLHFAAFAQGTDAHQQIYASSELMSLNSLANVELIWVDQTQVKIGFNNPQFLKTMFAWKTQSPSHVSIGEKRH